MRRLVDVLAPLGLVVIVGSLWWQRQGKTLPGESAWYLYAGFGLILLNLVLRWRDLADAVGARQMKYGANALVQVLVVLALLAGANWLSVRHTRRFDLTANQRFSLSDQTKKILAALEDDARLTYFQRETDTSTGARDRLKEYQSASPRIKVEYVDPWKKPTLTREYDITALPTLVVEYRGKREKVSFDSEQEITNALIKVTREGQKTVCFAEGEGERDVDDSAEAGLSAAKGALTRSQYQVKKVMLLREKGVPADCTVLAVTGPQNDLLPPVTEAIDAWVRAGGKALLMIEPGLDAAHAQPNYAALLAGFNLQAGDDVVVDVSGMGQLFGTGPITPLAMEYPYHDITRDFRVMTAFHTARSLGAASETQEGVVARDLVKTSQASWGESDLALREPVQLDEGKDKPGPLALAAVVTVTVKGPEPTPGPTPEAEDAPPPPPRPEGRVVAFGDADWASNALLTFQGNQDLFLNSVAWLAQDTDLISIRPKDPEDQRLVLTQDQQRLVTLTALAFIPGFFVVLGLVNWWRRRG